MKKAKTPRHTKTPSQKVTGVITSWTAPGMQNFVAIGSGVSVPQTLDFAVLLGWLVCSFFGVFNKATAYTPGRIFTKNTSNEVVPGKEVPFRGPDDYILYLDPYISEKPPFRGRILTGLCFFRPKTALTWGWSNINYLNRHRSPVKVV